ncbi:hypothetical protein Pan44_42040 [Caulifigura coniformis]|uniref:Uncharacterized protein n=2 Tax=Caulifigura coniformis TaxID=2527983 RepID=A0A517SJ45_9PLAN|nr:hypothetical protein Pan44_42040 [Caulifigura coniformis]
MVPAIAIALLVVGGAIALVFDRLWQDSAFLELRAAGEAAALAAANRLADDSTLRKVPDWETICQTARTAASDIAARNLVGGQPVKLWADEEGDIELGREIEDATGGKVFVRTSERPDCVAVHIEQGRGPSNPVGLLVRDLTGAGRLLRTTVRAKVDHHVAGLRPYEGVNAPMLPIAIAAVGPTGWDAAVTAGAGLDTSSVPYGTATVTPIPDGVSEVTVWSAPIEADPEQQMLATVHVFDIGNGLSGRKLADQCRDGWSADDLRKHGGELWLDGKPLTLKSTPKIPNEVTTELRSLIGQARMCLLYDAVTPGSSPDQWNLICSRLVAVRILAIQQSPDGMVVLQLQPAVVVTRTAIVDDEMPVLWNPYVCKALLTN